MGMQRAGYVPPIPTCPMPALHLPLINIDVQHVSDTQRVVILVHFECAAMGSWALGIFVAKKVALPILLRFYAFLPILNRQTHCQPGKAFKTFLCAVNVHAFPFSYSLFTFCRKFYDGDRTSTSRSEQ